MGCDIHAVIEYNGDGGIARGWAVPGIQRDYNLFRALAFAESADGLHMRYPPRGFPSHLSHESQQQFTHQGYLPDSDSPFDLRKAESVLAQDLHTPSWLSLSDLEEVLADFNLDLEQQTHTFQAVVAAMRVLAKRFGSGNVRLVYCFDG